MKGWKRNLVIAAVLLLACAGVYLNWLRGQSAVDLTDTLDADVVLGDSTTVMGEDGETPLTELALAQGEDVSASEYFAQMRLSRQEARDSAVELLQETMSYGAEGETGEASGKLTSLVSDTLAEAQI